jgi:diadenosine tetraphosphate (Ap4A) HIT family hydrolase
MDSNITPDAKDSSLLKYRNMCFKVAMYSGISTVVGFVIPIVGINYQREYPVIFAILAALGNIGISIFSISFSLMFVFRTDLINAYFERFRNLSGLVGLRLNRHGQSDSINELWGQRMSGASHITIYGTISKGWFFTYSDDLLKWLEDNTKATLHVGLLHPLGNIGRSRFLAASPTEVEKMIAEYDSVFVFLALLIAKYGKEKKVSVSLYDKPGFSVVWIEKPIGGYLYFSPYLPMQQRRESPELTFDTKSTFATQLIKLSKDLEDATATVKIKSVSEIHLIKYYLKDMSHRNTILNIPKLDCDFCREYRGLNTQYNFTGDGGKGLDTRIIWENDSFYIIPTLGPVVCENQAHLLINSKSHYTASAQLSAIEKKGLDEAVQFVKRMVGGECIFIENGIPTDDPKCNGGCGVTHLHIHAIEVTESFQFDSQNITAFIEARPLNSAINDEPTSLQVMFEECNLNEICASDAFLHTPYIHVKFLDQSFIWWMSHNDHSGKKSIGFRSQLMREWAFQHLNSPQTDEEAELWNWKNCIDIHNQRAVEQKAKVLRTKIASAQIV